MRSTTEMLMIANNNSRWIAANYIEMVKKYNNQWVGVLDKAVVGHGKDYEKLSLELKAKFGEKSDEITMEYISDQETNLILVWT